MKLEPLKDCITTDAIAQKWFRKQDVASAVAWLKNCLLFHDCTEFDDNCNDCKRLKMIDKAFADVVEK